MIINELLAISARQFAARPFNLKSAITKSLLYSMAYKKMLARQRKLLANTNSYLFTIAYRNLKNPRLKTCMPALWRATLSNREEMQ